MRGKIESNKGDERLRDLIDIIQFAEKVSTKIHGVFDEAEIYRVAMEEFKESRRYTASVVLLTDDGMKLRIMETALHRGMVRDGEKATGLQLKDYKIDLNKSSIYSQVVREGKTIHVNISDIISELFPRPLAYLISKTMGYENKSSILTPLYRHGKIIGVFAMSSTSLAEYFIPSVRNLAKHISTGLELAEEHAKRRRVEEEIIRTKEDLQNIIDSASEVIISFDANNRVTTWNNTAEFITGYKQREVIGKRINRLNVFDSPSKVVYRIKRVCDGNKDGFDELILKTKDGAKRIVRASCSAVTSDKDHNIGVLLIGKDITSDVGSHGRLLKGNSYFISNTNNKSAVDLFVDLTTSGYHGLFITRVNPDMVKSMTSLKGIQVVLLNQDKMGGFENIRDLDGLTAKIKEFTKENIDSLILLDRVDYLITLFSFERFVESLYQINSLISKNNSILLLYLNPSFLDTRQMAIIEAELQPLPDHKMEDVQIEDELYNILKFIQRQNQKNSLVSFKKISKEFSIVKSTSAKRLRMLEDEGMILVKKRGRSKTLYVSEKGKTLLNKRETI